MENKRKRTVKKAGAKAQTSNIEQKGMEAAKVIGDLSELEAIHAEPLTVLYRARGHWIKIEGRLLKPSELAPVRVLMDKAMPPMLPAENPGDPPRYDFRNENYLNEASACRRKARAIALYAAFPIFRKGKENLTNQEEILKHVENLNVDDGMLDVLFDRLTRDDKEVPHYVGFI